MKRILLLLLLLPALLTAQQRPDDWADFGRYAEANAGLAQAPAIVFMGNSITDYWVAAHPAFFTAGNYAGRGISGQVTAQVLARFGADVLALHPQAVVILAGTNDIALHDTDPELIAANIVSMAELADAAGIRPILCSVLPVKRYHWRPKVEDVPQKIRALNARLKHYAAQRGFAWVDYYPAMADSEGGMKAEYSKDGVHPNAAGYAVMERIIAPALADYK